MESVNLLIDGTYFANKVCLVLYRDNRIKTTVLYRLTDGEWEEELAEDIENLLHLGITIESVTGDGLHNILKGFFSHIRIPAEMEKEHPSMDTLSAVYP